MKHFRKELVKAQCFNVIYLRADNPGWGRGVVHFLALSLLIHGAVNYSTVISRFGIWHNKQIGP